MKLVNPYFIKQLPGRKSDVKDAQWIAECTMKDLVRGSFVPSERIQPLLVSSDSSPQEKQEEGARGSSQKTSHRSVARAARREGLRRFQPWLQGIRQQRVMSDIPPKERL